MKKLVAALITAFLMSFGLVATSSSPASAACPYSGCLPTETNAVKLKPRGPNKARVFVKVSTFGNGQADGRLNFTFVKRSGKSFTFDRAYPSRGGKKFVYNFKPLPKGRYSIIVTFVPSNDSAFEGSSDEIAKYRVKGNRRR